MRQAVFITGFNNWGKSTIISELFGRERFSFGDTYPIQEVNFNTRFTVQSQSNDDLWQEGYINRITRRIREAPDSGENFFSALCPTIENGNSFVRILTRAPLTSYERLHIFLIEFKWEHHARLLLDNILEAGQQIPNANFVIINADQHLTNQEQRATAKLTQIRSELNNIFDIQE